MYCVICQALSLQIICKTCLENLWHIESKRELLNGLKVFSSFALSELKYLVYSKNNIIGSRVLTRLGKYGVQKFFECHQEILTIQKKYTAVICIRNRTIGAYSHSAILAHCFKKYGFRVFNHAQNDATVGNYGVKTIEERSVLTQIDNVSFEDNDIAIIFAGTNDFKTGNCPIGNDVDQKDTTFKGSLNLVIQKIFEKNKSIRLLFITPVFRSRIDSGDNRDSDSTKISGRMLKDYSDAIKTISEINHIPVLDMYGSGLINKYNSEHWLYDGLYFSQEGHKLFATTLYKKLSSLY